MSVTLYSPTQAKALSASGVHQLESLVTAARRVLDSSGVTWLHESPQAMNAQQSDTDCNTITISMVSVDSCHQPPAALTIRPRFPGALVSHDIEFSGDTRGFRQGQEDTRTLMEADHYGSFAPLPYTLLKASGLTETGRKPGLHLLCVVAGSLTEQSSTRQEQIQMDIDELCRVIQILDTVSAVTIMCGPDLNGCEHRNTDELAEQLETMSQSVRRRVNIPVFTPSQTANDNNWLSALMVKFDIALFAGSSWYVDAVQLGIPAYTWRMSQAMTPFNCWVQQHATANWATDKQTINQQQQDYIWRDAAANIGTVISNNVSHFEFILLEFLASKNTVTGSTATVFNQHAESVIPPITANYPGSQLHQTRHIVSRTHRKLRKFGQSPVRFIRDSNSAWAKLVHPFLRDPAA